LTNRVLARTSTRKIPTRSFATRILPVPTSVTSGPLPLNVILIQLSNWPEHRISFSHFVRGVLSTRLSWVRIHPVPPVQPPPPPPDSGGRGRRWRRCRRWWRS